MKNIKEYRKAEAVTHELKILPEYFEAVLNGNKTFELRKDDRGFKVGDTLILKEFKPGIYDSSGPEKVTIKECGYTGREVEKKITYIFKGGTPFMGLRKGYAILNIK